MKMWSVWPWAAVIVAAGCAVAPPSGPTVLALPGKDKNFAQFEQDDTQCRAFAQSRIGATTPGQASTNAAVGSAAVGTVLGAAAGALIGSVSGNVGAGAAIGAGTGLVGGSLVGAGNAGASGAAVQQQYDFAYIQCMTANGDNIQSAARTVTPAYGYPATYYADPYPAAVVVGPPVVSFGFGGGYGGYWGHRPYYGGGPYWRHY